MKKSMFAFLVMLLVFSVFLAGCNKDSSNSGYSNEGKGTKVELWTFNELHGQYYEKMAEMWNEENPDDQISIKVNTYPYEDLHNKLLVALQSGKGAPDISDIEISKFGNFLKGTPQILPLDDVVDPERENVVQSRLDIYSKDGVTYGIDFHVGAAVIYYNKEIMDKAGVNPDDIVTWEDFKEAGKLVVEKTGIPMTTLDVEDQWSFWPQVAQLEGNDDLLDHNGNFNLTDSRIVDVLKYQQELVKEGIAIPAPGNDHHAEEYYGFMNNGGAASVWMPMWYMGRFTDYMPDLKGKIIIRPMPSWKEGSPRSAGMGGTGTVVTNQSEHPEFAKKFLAYAKLSKEGNIKIWQLLGFDPIRTDVWELPELKESNQFTEYFGPNIFDTLLEVEDEIEGVNIGEKTPDVSNAVKTTILFQTLIDRKDPQQVLEEAQKELE